MSLRGSRPLTLIVNTNANGALINAVNGTAYAVLGYTLSTNANVQIKLQSNATDIIGGVRILANSTVCHPPGSTPIAQTTVGDPLNLNISAASIISGHITYITI